MTIQSSWRTLISMPLLFLAVICNGVSASTQRYAFSTIHSEAIDSIGGIWAIQEGPQGFIWFGGENGLARFDGHEVKLYRNIANDDRSLSSSYVHALLLDSRGVLWVGTTYGLNRYDPQSDGFDRFFNNPNNMNSLSGNGVRSLLEDQFGSIWVGHGESGLTRYDPSLELFSRFRHDPNNSLSLSEDKVYALAKDNDGAIWIGTNSKGLDRLLVEQTTLSGTATFEHFRHGPTDNASISNNAVRSLFVDRMNQLWVGTTNGLNKFNAAQGTFERFYNITGDDRSLSFNFVQALAEDDQGNLWVSTSGGGLNLLDRRTLSFTRYSHHPNERSSVLNNNARALFLDKNGNFWLGHFASGVAMLDRYASAFTNFYHNPYQEDSLNFNEIVAVTEGREGVLWVGTARGLNELDLRTRKVKRYLHNPQNSQSINEGGVLDLLYDDQHRLWAGLWGGGLNRLNPDTGEFTHFLSQPGSDQGLFTDTVWGLYQDSSGTIWAGNHLGGLTAFQEPNRFIRVPSASQEPGGISCSSVFEIFEDSEKGLWVGCSNGLNYKKYGDPHFQHFFHIENRPESISANHIWAIQEDREGYIWIGTQGGGVNRYEKKTGKFKVFRVSDGLPDDLVTGILQDEMGYLWFATGHGLSRFDPVKQTFRNYDRRHGLPGNVFNRAAFTKTSTNELVFGSKDGLSIVNPRLLAINNKAPDVVFTDFQLFNKSVGINEPGSPLDRAINVTEKIVLSAFQSSFSVQFAALNYRVPSMNRYEYKLEGFDNDWVNAGSRRWAYYTNLDPGMYRLVVRAANNEGVWNQQGTSLDIIIVPPWYRTTWAYLLYFAAFLAFLSLLIYTFWQRKMAESERRVSDRLREIDKVKDTFLANTSHELRTPLNGIIGLADSLLNGVAGPVSEEAHRYLTMIVISGKRLANLVNDILDFSKLRESKISLRKTPVDLFSVSQLVQTLFEPLLRDRNIELINRIPDGFPYVLADENRLQQILYNLIGNAVKFTDEGYIELSVEDQGDHVEVFVKDTGVGIAEDKQDLVFQSFAQVDNDTANPAAVGTGLGLTVTKQLVELHRGSIRLTSTLGEGSTFSFTLPKSKEGVAPTVNKDALGSNPQAGSYVFCPYPEEDAEETVRSQPHILVVDDEPVNRLVLDGFLKVKHYRITECSNGLEALDFLSAENDIALVLLDVMMPKMTGFETCKKIRQRYTAKELPVIFLTGKNMREDLEAGFDAGGNDFLTKPVAKEELLLRVSTHLKLSTLVGD